MLLCAYRKQLKPIHFVIKLSGEPGELRWPEGTHVRDHVKALAVI